MSNTKNALDALNEAYKEWSAPDRAAELLAKQGYDSLAEMLKNGFRRVAQAREELQAAVGQEEKESAR